MCIHGMGHIRGSNTPTHWPLMTETAGSSGPRQCSLQGLPPEGYGARSAIETTQVDTGNILGS